MALFRQSMTVPLTRIILIAVAACMHLWASPSVATADDGTAEALYKRGLMRLNEEKLIAARLDFSEIVKNYRSSPRITASYMFLAKIYYALGEYDEAATTAIELRRRFPRSSYNDWAQYMIGACQYRQDKNQDALKTLIRLAGTTKDGTIRSRALRALRYFIQPVVDPGDFAEALQNQNIDPGELEALEPFTVADRETSEVITESESTEAPPEPPSPMERREWVVDGVVRIGLVAPLTGAFAQQGAQLRLGAEEALHRVSSADGKKIELIVEDTESSMVIAALKVRKLAQEGVIAIIGPVYGESTVSAAIESQHNSIPFIAPTAQNDNLTSLGSYIFQLNSTPAVQAEALAELAINRMGMKTTAVIASKDEWGETVADVFGSAVRSRGGRIVKTAFVEPNASLQDINPLIMSIRDQAPATTALPESTIVIDNGTAYPDTIVVKLDPSTYGPQRIANVTTIDGVLISALCRDAVLIAQHLDDYNIRTTLLGDSGWGSEDVAEIGGVSVDGAYIVAPSDYYHDDAAMDRYNITLQDIVAKKGFDALALLASCIADGASDPESLVLKLESVRDFGGISSYITIDPKRHKNTAVTFVRIRDGRYEKLR